jgi:CBS-domain-containing membrane protein/PII-like signaling protein
MDIVGTGKRVRIYIGELDKAAGHHEPLWETILEFLRKEGAAGATMVRGLAGFGAHSKLHVARFPDLVPDLPVLVEWIDGPERVERLLPHISELVRTGTITLEDVDIVKYTHRDPRPLPPDRVDEVMTRDVVSVHPDTPLGEVVRQLLDRDFRALPVVDAEQRLVGIITNRDLVERGGLSARVELLGALAGSALERELAASGIRGRPAADVMTTEVTNVRPDEALERAAHMMAEQRIKRLPVVDYAGRLVGILSRVDVLRTMGEDYHAPSAAEQPPTHHPARVVGDLIRTDVPSVSADAPLGVVLDAVTSTRLNRAIVVDGDRRVLGVVTDADLLRRLDPGAETGLIAALMGRGRFRGETKATARDVMRTPALTVSADMPLAEAAQRMLEARRKVLPITDGDGRLLGVADRADLLGSMRTSAAVE